MTQTILARISKSGVLRLEGASDSCNVSELSQYFPGELLIAYPLSRPIKNLQKISDKCFNEIYQAVLPQAKAKFGLGFELTEYVLTGQ